MLLILIDSEPPSSTGGGIRTYTRRVAEAWRADGGSVRIYSQNPEAYSGLDARKVGRSPSLRFGLRALLYKSAYGEAVDREKSLWIAEELASLTGPWVAEFPDFQGWAWASLQREAWRDSLILRVHTPAFLTRKGRKPVDWLLRRRERACLRLARRLSFPSAAFVRECLPSLGPGTYLPNPPPEPAALPPPPLRPEPFRILFLGRIEERKGVATLIEAFAEAMEAGADLTLTLVGEDADPDFVQDSRRRLQALPAPTRERILRRPAMRGDKAALFLSVDAVVVPSLWENCPYVFLEGIAHGRPVLGSLTGEMGAAARVWGWEAPEPGKVRAWSKALVRLAQDPEHRRRLLDRQQAYFRNLHAEAMPRLLEFYRRRPSPSS